MTVDEEHKSNLPYTFVRTIVSYCDGRRKVRGFNSAAAYTIKNQ